MQTHVKVLAILYIVLGALGVLTAITLLLLIGGAASIVGMAADQRDALIAVPIIGIAGTALVMFLLALSLPGIVAGWGLLQVQAVGATAHDRTVGAEPAEHSFRDGPRCLRSLGAALERHGASVRGRAGSDIVGSLDDAPSAEGRPALDPAGAARTCERLVDGRCCDPRMPHVTTARTPVRLSCRQ